MRGVVHHMTGDDEEWGQRFAVLHLDSLYLWPGSEQHDEPQLMICVSEPAVSLAYAEGVIEVKGRGGRAPPDGRRAARHRALVRGAEQGQDRAGQRGQAQDGRRRRRQQQAVLAEQPARAAAGHRRVTVTADGGGRLRLQPAAADQADAAGEQRCWRGRGAAQQGRARAVRPYERDEDVYGASATDSSITPTAALHRTLQPAPNVSSTSALDDSAYLRSLLLHGALFTKYKHKRGKQRWIWCSPALDTLYWAEEKGRKVKGQLHTSAITGVADGCVGVRRKGVGLTIVAEDRTLDLEARDEEQQKDWLRAVGLLINLNKQ